jgi:pilus assembly protein CpaE
MGQSLNVVAMLRTPQLRSALAEVCTGMNGTRFDLRVAPLTQISAESTLPASDLLMVEVDPKDAAEMELLRGMVERRQDGPAIVATTADATLDDVRKLMRLGVVDVIPQPVQRSDVLAALEAAAKFRRAVKAGEPAGGHKGRLVSVLKGGGGVGATTVAVQTGCCLAQALQKRGQEACLLDLDVQGGTVALYLDLNDRVGLADLVEAGERLDTDLLQGATTRHSSGLSVVAAPREVMPLESFTPDFVRRLTAVTRSRFEVVLADLPPAWSLWSFEVLRQSDEILLVTQMTVPGVRQARRQLDTLRAEGLDDLPVRVVLNRFEKRWGATFTVKEVEKALGRSVDFTVANDYRTVSEALDQGLSLAAVRRRSKTLKSITKISNMLAAGAQRAEGRLEPQLAGMAG